jgi:8-oxo-dGTP pyrophosphatase MutT (NUDIX family)
MIEPATIVPASRLLSSALPCPFRGFAPLWLRSERIGAVSPAWLSRLDSRIFKLEDDESGDLPLVRVRSGDRHAAGGPISTATLNRWFAEWAGGLKAQGMLPGWRGEVVQLYGANESVPLLAVERSLLRPLGLLLRTVQVNVFTFQDKRLKVWIARRADRKPVDPGKLDSLVGGGIAGDETPLETLVRECHEEAGISRKTASGAVPVGVVDSTAATYDGDVQVLHRERMMVYDLRVPQEFRPALLDGESSEALCLSVERAFESLTVAQWTNEGAWAIRDLLRRYAPVATVEA